MGTTALAFRKRFTPKEAMTAAIDAFYRRCEAKNLSSHSIDYYRYRFNAWERFLAAQGIEVAPEEVTPDIIRAFLADEMTRISPLTASHSYVTLKCFFSFLEDDGMVSVNPMAKVQPVKTRKQVMHTFETASLQSVLEQTGNDFNGVRLRALLLLLADTGLRASELCGIRLADISVDAQTAKVLGKGNKERLVAFGKMTKQALQGYLSRRGDIEGQDTLFVTCYGEPLTRHRLHRLLKEQGESIGIPDLTPHNFRRYFAREFIRGGGDCFVLQRCLGHTSLEMSRRYSELANTDVLAAQKRLSPSDRLPASATGQKRKMLR